MEEETTFETVQRGDEGVLSCEEGCIAVPAGADQTIVDAQLDHSENVTLPTEAVADFLGYHQPDSKFDAFERAQGLSMNLPCIILVNTWTDQNVGSIARTMLNFGLTELRLVNPIADIATQLCRNVSVGAYKIVQEAEVFTDLRDAIKDLSKVYATSDRPRRMTQLVYTTKKAVEEALHLGKQGERVGIVFGNERHGLNNEEVALADTLVTIPTFSHFTSLNLAQAVNVVCYEIWMQAIALNDCHPPEEWLQPRDHRDQLAQKHELENFFKRIENQLDAVHYHQGEGTRRSNCLRAMRGIFQRVLLQICTFTDIKDCLFVMLGSDDSSRNRIDAWSSICIDKTKQIHSNNRRRPRKRQFLKFQIEITNNKTTFVGAAVDSSFLF